MEIKRFTADDETRWKELAKEYDPDLSEDQIHTAWTRVQYGGSITGLGIFVDNALIGFVTFNLHNFVFSVKPTLYLSDIYIEEKHRRNGYATKIIDYLIIKAREFGCGRIYWVTEHANPARSIYDKVASPDFVRYHLDL